MTQTIGFNRMEEENNATESIWIDNLTSTAYGNFNEPVVGFPGKNSPYTATQAILLAVLLGTIIVGTIVGNILVCVAVCLVRKLRRPCNYLLVSLAVSDLCVAMLVMPMALFYEILGNWPFGPIVCDLWVSFDVLSCTASILNLCMISVDRYHAITKPLEYGVKRTPRRMIIYVALVWFGAACISLPPLIILGNEHTYSETGSPHCAVCQNFAYQIYATLGSFYIPLVVMIEVYYKIFLAARKIVLEEKRARSHLETHCYLEADLSEQTAANVHRSTASTIQAAHCESFTEKHRCSSSSTICTGRGMRCFRSEPRKSNESQCPMLQKSEKSISPSIPTVTPTTGPTIIQRHQKSTSSASYSPHQKRLRFQLVKERKASTTLGIIMSAFTICWLPFFVLALVRPFLHDANAIPQSLSSLFLWLGYCNSLLNPIIYATLNKDFRKPFREILYFRCSNLNHMMREEYYQSQYGDPTTNYVIKIGEIENRLNNHKAESIETVSHPADESFL
ncbi:5-hydroxytryptamine receptor 1 [Orussus abietinus]|uniref:5-hydroxytryptamine receptor 1 n=1 Tax=Orussus abietinus TaxID=222816 RepID=UPI0006263760|nr:5-hydroxytryptamine receptor 1 [Orussus abietinus]XP_012287541.1 5-hydroxytryptamine receptor 1 [Orussus abietinus]